MENRLTEDQKEVLRSLPLTQYGEDGRPLCYVEGCSSPARRWLRKGDRTYQYGLECKKHYALRLGHGYGEISRKKLELGITTEKCSICGWEGPCEVHRVTYGCDGGRYAKGNVVVLCPNCHTLVHHGKLDLR
jgi:hypothetical protein